MIERLLVWIERWTASPCEKASHRKCPVCGADLDLPGARQVHEEVLAEFARRQPRSVPPCEGGQAQ